MQMTNQQTPSSRLFFRMVAQLLVATVLLYFFNRYLAYWHDWPDLTHTLGYLTGADADATNMQLVQGLMLYLLYIAVFVFIVWQVKHSPATRLRDDSRRFAAWAYFVVRAAFWSVFLIGMVDAAISFLRIESITPSFISESWWVSLDQAKTRGAVVHYPLIALSLVIAWFTRSLGFIWLAFLVVLAEFGIVLSRFIFSYEQAFMGDLVRFWYAALFLFASAYTLVEDGHVRVDVLYAGLPVRAKAWVNAFGSLLLGLPFCWVILTMGMGSAQSSLISPIISFEISQSGYGMYVQYLMAGFLLVFALSMALVFISYFLDSVADITGEELPEELA